MAGVTTGIPSSLVLNTSKMEIMEFCKYYAHMHYEYIPDYFNFINILGAWCMPI